jgi:CYTH domain-containing protein
VHLVSVARDLPQLYTLENNDARQETSIEDAIASDDRTLRAWLGHPRLRIVGNDVDDFRWKLRRILQAVLRGLGVPVPLAAEKKFLLASPPDLTHPALAGARAIEIEQIYLLSADPDRELRVRRRTEAGSSTFYRTEKVIIPELEARQEREQRISSGDYERLLASRDPQLQSIVKTRYCFAWGSSYMELDVFDAPSGISLLEVEATEGGRLELPPFLDIDRDVTGETGWMNHTLAAARCELPSDH